VSHSRLSMSMLSVWWVPWSRAELASRTSRALRDGVIVRTGRWLPVLTIISFSTPSEAVVLLPGFALFCPLFVGDLLLPSLFCWLRTSARWATPSRIGRPVGASWAAAMLLCAAGWYLGRTAYTALTLAISSFLTTHWWFHASCCPLQLAHFLVNSLLDLIGHSRDPWSCAQ
jgi:hypothetical protein